ncbi:MAG: single-stranded DNA-binding protein, partial [Holdemanella sp.]|nr:single-stranded DNA-binding protein [Holdemanella sp.]
LAVDGGGQTEYIRCRAWNGLAETMVKYLSKGSMISIQGKLHTYKMVRDDQASYIMEVVADSVRFLSARKKEAASGEVDEIPANTEAEDNTAEEKKDIEYAEDLVASAIQLQLSEDDLPF